MKKFICMGKSFLTCAMFAVMVTVGTVVAGQEQNTSRNAAEASASKVS